MYVFVNLTLLLRSGHFTVGKSYLHKRKNAKTNTQKKTHIENQPKKKKKCLPDITIVFIKYLQCISMGTEFS